MGRLSLISGIMLCLSAPAVADFDASAYPPYERCAICHGLFGQSHTSKFPHLAGQKPAYIQAQLDAFLTGTRTNDGGQMAAIVTELRPEEFAVVVEWFSTQEPPAPDGPTRDDLGKTHVETLGCAGCHDDQPQGAPHLTAQHAGYLEKQMTDFISGARTEAEIAGVHQDMLSPIMADLGAIASYLSSQVRAQ